MCRRERQVNAFGRCTICSTVIAGEQHRSKAGLWLLHGAKGLVPPLLLGGVVYVALDVAFWNSSFGLMSGNHVARMGLLLVFGGLMVAAPVLAANARG